MQTDTAHIAWNRRWATPDGRREWLVPEEDVVAVTEKLAAEGKTRRVLDLGCGVGRHALHLARLGFEVEAVDLAEAGVEELRRAAAEDGLTVSAATAPMNELPFADAAFDYVLSFNVIYHGDESIVRATLDEIRRVLRPGGVYQGTMLSKRHVKCGLGTEVAPNTFVLVDDEDRGHPHYYCNARELVGLFSGFEPLSIVDRSHSSPNTWHWHIVAERLPG